MHHMFDVAIASKYGVNVAIFLNNMSYWIHKNMAEKRHIHDGRCWTYNSQSSFSVLFPYWSRQNIRTIIERCLTEGLIIKGNYNKLAYDQTTWYTFTDKGLSLYPILEQLHATLGWNQPGGRLESTNESAETNQPIPNINTNKKPVSSSTTATDNFLNNTKSLQSTESDSDTADPYRSDQALDICDSRGLSLEDELQRFEKYYRDKEKTPTPEKFIAWLNNSRPRQSNVMPIKQPLVNDDPNSDLYDRFEGIPEVEERLLEIARDIVSRTDANLHDTLRQLRIKYRLRNYKTGLQITG